MCSLIDVGAIEIYRSYKKGEIKKRAIHDAII